MENGMNNGAHIKAYRKENNLTQAAFVEYFPEFNMKQEHVSFYEQGRRSIPPEILETMIMAGVIPEGVTGAPERIKQLASSLTHEDQTLVEQFVMRMLK